MRSRSAAPSASSAGAIVAGEGHSARRDSRGSARRSQSVSGAGYRGLETGREGDATNFLPMDYALVLSALQQAPEFNSPASLHHPLKIDAVEAQLFGHLSSRRAPMHRHKLGAKDADTVDLVGMIFRYDARRRESPRSGQIAAQPLAYAVFEARLCSTRIPRQSATPRASLLLNQMAETGTRWVADEKDRVGAAKTKTVRRHRAARIHRRRDAVRAPAWRIFPAFAKVSKSAPKWSSAAIARRRRASSV